MRKKIPILFCLITITIVGTLVFIFNKTIDYPTLFLAFKLMLPSGLIAYICGYYMDMILKTAKVETTLLVNDSQNQFVDDLLISPSQVLYGDDFYEGNHFESAEQTEKDKDKKVD